MKHDPRAFAAAALPGTAPPGTAPPGTVLSGTALQHAVPHGSDARDVARRVRRFMPLVRRLARQVRGSAAGGSRGGAGSGIELEDLMQAGLVALTECAQRQEQRQGQQQWQSGEDGFAAYAKLRVRGAMVDLVRRAAPLSRGAADRRRLLRGVLEGLRGDLGRDPTTDEIAAALGLTSDELAALRANNQPLRFEPMDEVYSDHNPAFADERPDSLALLSDEQTRAAVLAAIAALAERLHLVVRLYFVEERNLAEIAQLLQVSIPRVHQLKAQALGQLRAGLADEL